LIAAIHPATFLRRPLAGPEVNGRGGYQSGLPQWPPGVWPWPAICGACEAYRLSHICSAPRHPMPALHTI